MARFGRISLISEAVQRGPGLRDPVQRLQIAQERLKLAQGDHIGAVRGRTVGIRMRFSKDRCDPHCGRGAAQRRCKFPLPSGSRPRSTRRLDGMCDVVHHRTPCFAGHDGQAAKVADERIVPEARASLGDQHPVVSGASHLCDHIGHVPRRQKLSFFDFDHPAGSRGGDKQVSLSAQECGDLQHINGSRYSLALGGVVHISDNRQSGALTNFSKDRQRLFEPDAPGGTRRRAIGLVKGRFVNEADVETPGDLLQRHGAFERVIAALHGARPGEHRERQSIANSHSGALPGNLNDSLGSGHIHSLACVNIAIPLMCFMYPPCRGSKFLWYQSLMVNSLDIARTVLSLEIKGLEALKSGLGDEFVKAVELLRQTKGRLAVTGMGKSGHVARKIAATFSSTGTPALFVHPAEASHGDLGMISKDDVILALSKSGETAELGDLLAYAARWSIPVVSITSTEQSALAAASSIPLILPDIEEACGETFAPTTSTTMMMALGDALAVALLRARGFSASDFQGFHPGGKLGAALRKARDLMHGADSLPLVAMHTPMTKVVETISAGRFGCAGIVDDQGRLKGIITDGDIRRHFTRDTQRQTAADVMTKNPHTAAPDTLAGDILALMSKTKITALFVIDNEKPVGIIHVHDCLTIGVV